MKKNNKKIILNGSGVGSNNNLIMQNDSQLKIGGGKLDGSDLEILRKRKEIIP